VGGGGGGAGRRRRALHALPVALAATTGDDRRGLREAVRCVRAVVGATPVLVGGGAVPDEAAARRLGADGRGRDATALVGFLEALPPSP
jgi:hypothetical protein